MSDRGPPSILTPDEVQFVREAAKDAEARLSGPSNEDTEFALHMVLGSGVPMLCKTLEALRARVAELEAESRGERYRAGLQHALARLEEASDAIVEEIEDSETWEQRGLEAQLAAKGEP